MSPTLLSEACQNSAKHVTITIVYVSMDYTTQLMVPDAVSRSVVLTILPCRAVEDGTFQPPTCELPWPGQGSVTDFLTSLNQLPFQLKRKTIPL